MFRRLFRDEPELLALALIVFILASAAFDQPVLRLPRRAFVPAPPDVRMVIPELPPPANPIERIRF